MSQLKGMTWSHPRGYDPIVAAAREWHRRTGIEITWDKRSLQDFESFPVEQLAREYDFIVIDHPHIGQVVAEGCLLPLDVPAHEAERAQLSAASVGPSFRSYLWQGRQWALPIDAATQVQAMRAAPGVERLTDWFAVRKAGQDRRLLLPMRNPHALMCFYSIAANLGHPCATDGDDLIQPEAGAETWDYLRELAALVDPVSFEMDPIAAYEELAQRESWFTHVPLGYGYVSYAMAGFRPTRLSFCDIPEFGRDGPAGTVLGGTGIAVSAFCQAPAAAMDFAYWLAGAEVQAGLYARAGGQPGHAEAWKNGAINQQTNCFYHDTKATLDGAWLRPRHNGYMAFQAAASDAITAALQAGSPAHAIITTLNSLYRNSKA